MDDRSEGHSPDLPTEAGRSVGRPVRRLEDERLLRGGGRYISDLIAKSGALRVAILRSPCAHGRILKVDPTGALSVPGVVTAITSRDLEGIGELPCDWRPPGMVAAPLQSALARDRVRYQGEPLAAVAADSAHASEDALGSIYLSLEALPAVADQEAAIGQGAVLLHDTVPGNIGFNFRRSGGDVDQAFAKADVIVRRRLANNRVSPAPLEGRAVLSQFDPKSGRLEHYTSSQTPHVHARSLSACLGLPQQKVRLMVPDVGGGFGSKLCLYPEDLICAILAIRTGRPCAWLEGRSESFSATTHGRDQVQYVELAARRDGRVTALRSRIVVDIGAYAIGMGPGVPAFNTGLSVTGSYQIPNVETEVIGVFTNRTPTGPYRGAGHPEATFLIERMMHELARELELDQAEIRRLNFVPANSMPHPMATGWTLDSGDYAASLEKALALAGYREWRERQESFRAQGRLLGIGLACFAEGSGIGASVALGAHGFRRAGHESARVVVHADGHATVFSGSMSTGQGHVTALAQIAGDVLGLRPEDVEVIQGDTRSVPFGTGTYNSRSMAVGGSAVHQAASRIMEKVRSIAAYKLRTRPQHLEYQHGVFRQAGGFDALAAAAGALDQVKREVVKLVVHHRTGLPPSSPDGVAESVSLADVAREAHLGHDLPAGMVPGLDETAFFDPADLTFAYGTHVVVVEVDVETGQVGLLKHIVVDDCGRMINPLLVEGQVHGGATQGIGQALMEAIVHEADGEASVRGFQEYAMPRASDVPSFETGHTEIPSKLNPLGVKGVGEGATIGATPAVINAIMDALAHLGIKEIAMPATPMNVWRAIRRACDAASATSQEPEGPSSGSTDPERPAGRIAEGGLDA